MKTLFEMLPLELLNIVFYYCNQTSLRNLRKIDNLNSYRNTLNKFIEKDLQLTINFQALKILSRIHFCLGKESQNQLLDLNIYSGSWSKSLIDNTIRSYRKNLVLIDKLKCSKTPTIMEIILKEFKEFNNETKNSIVKSGYIGLMFNSFLELK
jgi:hypothetical protein